MVRLQGRIDAAKSSIGRVQDRSGEEWMVEGVDELRLELDFLAFRNLSLFVNRQVEVVELVATDKPEP